MEYKEIRDREMQMQYFPLVWCNATYIRSPLGSIPSLKVALCLRLQTKPYSFVCLDSRF